jgi:hypothetical protein
LQAVFHPPTPESTASPEIIIDLLLYMTEETPFFISSREVATEAAKEVGRAEKLERVFQPFEGAEDVTPCTEEAGLGLSICHQLLGLMHSEPHVESEVGRGSIFWFEVALPVMTTAVEAAPPPEQIITGYRGPRRTVLVI